MQKKTIKAVQYPQPCTCNSHIHYQTKTALLSNMNSIVVRSASRFVVRSVVPRRTNVIDSRPRVPSGSQGPQRNIWAYVAGIGVVSFGAGLISELH
ncbi:hypothetical protein BJ742DRAFT_772252 [Cladochytrium replicatum]|nr:hypothetical protein BJ742DRAFT_772252 [Cladochytrium replicatum]